MSVEFVPGHCYVAANEQRDNQTVMLCRRSMIYGLQLVPTKGLLRFATPCSSNEVTSKNWIDCTEQVKRSEALKNCDSCPLIPISKDMVGTVIAVDVDGVRSIPYFLYAYNGGVAFLMALDGTDEMVTRPLKMCYPLQRTYKDIAERAISPDPLKSSIFDSFLRWIGKTPQYNYFVSMVNEQSPENREDMIKLFECLSYEGVTAETFDEEVRARYALLSEKQRQESLSMYTAVLLYGELKASKYNKVEKEIMRRTAFKYKSPEEAWLNECPTKPFPKTLKDVDICVTTPAMYVCDALGYYEGDAEVFWQIDVIPTIGEHLDMETSYKEGVDRYLSIRPDFDMRHLSFIQEEDKERVFKDILGVAELDAKDPYREWTKNPPPHFRKYRSECPMLSYVEIFKLVYRQSRAR